MVIDTNFFSCLTCDAPEAWQAALSEPASITTEGSLIFNNHLLFLLIVITLFVGWLLYNTIFFYEEFNNKFISKFVNCKKLKIVWTTIPAGVVKKNKFFLKENSQLKPAKNKSSWDPIQAQFKMYNFSYIILLLITLQFGLPFISCYLTIGYLYYIKLYWAKTQDNDRSDSNWFSKSKNKMNEFFDLLQFYVNEYKIILLFIAFLFSIIKENYFATVYFVIFLGLSYSKKLEFPQIFSDKIDSIKQDMETIKIHKKEDFVVINDWLKVTWITLGITFLLSPMVRSSGILESLYFINGTLWIMCFEAALLINLVLELYIIFYANTPVESKVVIACVKCGGTAIVGGLANQFAAEQGLFEPNEFTNRVRTEVSKKPAITTSDDAIIDKSFRRHGVHEDEYTTERESKYGGKPMKYVDPKKAYEVANRPENKEIIMKMGTEKEKVAHGLKPRRNGFFF
jgi:hypothetical protein